jgi:hypothetical protein
MSISETPIAAFTVNNTLNPILWDNDELRNTIKYKLLSIAKHFADTLKVKNLNLKDITINGSNASFGYSEYSDIDLHLVVDMANNEELEDYYNVKKNEFNNKYDVKLKGIVVEVYVQNSKQPHHSAGIYSVLDNRWLHKPSKEIPKATPQEIRSKARNYSSKINQALGSKDLSASSDIMADIRRLRQAGLETNGENSVENLAYKLLRSRGRIDKLAKHINKLQVSSLSLGEEMKIKEILGEDDTTPMKVQSVTGDKAVIDQAGTDIEVSKDDLIANPDKPGELQLKSDPNQIKPGATVTTPNTAVAENQEEDLENKDVIDSGKISGDPTEKYINDIRDKRFERGARGSMSSKESGSFGPISGKLKESDELYKWLMIAGIK